MILLNSFLKFSPGGHVMKYIYMCVLLMMGVVTPAFAADEFGARFSKTVPAALGAMPEAMGPFSSQNSPADIEPAAGDDIMQTDGKIPAKIEYMGPEPISSSDMAGAVKPLDLPPLPQPLQ